MIGLSVLWAVSNGGRDHAARDVPSASVTPLTSAASLRGNAIDATVPLVPERGGGFKVTYQAFWGLTGGAEFQFHPSSLRRSQLCIEYR